MGDARRLLNGNAISKEDFAVYHPGGALGKKLLLRVKIY
jgi:D-arabinose 5-phosphate isomerase GutQ